MPCDFMYISPVYSFAISNLDFPKLRTGYTIGSKVMAFIIWSMT